MGQFGAPIAVDGFQGLRKSDGVPHFPDSKEPPASRLSGFPAIPFRASLSASGHESVRGDLFQALEVADVG